MLHTPLFELYRRLPYLGDTMKKETKAMLEMLAAAALWSIAGIIMKFIPWNDFAVSGMRSLISGLTFVVYMRIKGMRFVFTKQTFIAGLFAAGVYTCFTCANKLTTAANAIVLQFTSPVFIVIFTALIYKTKIRKADLLVPPEMDVFAAVQQAAAAAPLACVLCDESQFFTPQQAEELFMVTVELNIPVICYGLRSDFSLKGFPGSTRLLELAHTIEEMKTICTCGRKAICNCRKVNGVFVFEGEQVAIDLENDVQYVSMCPQCYFRERRAFYARRAAK